MGMHHGYLVAPVPADRLLAALTRLTGEFQQQGESQRLADVDLGSHDDGFPIAIADIDGGSVLLDSSFILSSEPDLIVDLSKEFGGYVAGAGAETTSGSYWLVAAQDGRLLRNYHNSAWGQTKPFDRGDPMPSEATQPLEDLDGVGLTAALATLGFDIRGWEDAPGSMVSPYIWTYDRPPEDGPLSAERNEFLKEFGIDPDAPLPTPTVVQRAEGGFDLAPSASKDPPAAPKESKGFLDRLLGR